MYLNVGYRSFAAITDFLGVRENVSSRRETEVWNLKCIAPKLTCPLHINSLRIRLFCSASKLRKPSSRFRISAGFKGQTSSNDDCQQPARDCDMAQRDYHREAMEKFETLQLSGIGGGVDGRHQYLARQQRRQCNSHQ